MVDAAGGFLVGVGMISLPAVEGGVGIGIFADAGVEARVRVGCLLYAIRRPVCNGGYVLLPYVLFSNRAISGHGFLLQLIPSPF